MSLLRPSSSTSIRQRFGVMTVVVALLGALLSVGGTVTTASADATGSISGTVTVAGSPGTDVSGAAVSLYDSVQQYLTTTTTDSDGNFSFPGLSAGSYTLDFASPAGDNFVEQWWNGQPAYQDADYFPLADGQSLTGMDVALAPGATLSGTVLGAGSPNVPVPGARLSLQGAGGAPIFETGFADSNGNFTIGHIAAGTYTLEFSPPFGSTTYIPQWWQNQSSESSEQTITIGAAQTLTGYNAVLPLGASISGTVIGADPSAPVSGTSVEALQGGNA